MIDFHEARAERGGDGLSRGVQARVRSLQRAVDDLGDFFHAELLELVQHEHLALAVVESRQNLAQARARATELQIARLLRGRGQVRRRLAELFVPAMRALAVVRGLARADSVNPGAN